MSFMRQALVRLSQAISRQLVPGLRNSQYAYYEALQALLQKRELAGQIPTRPIRWLDIGCGHNVFGHWMKREQDNVIQKRVSMVGLDMDLDGLKENTYIKDKVLADIQNAPFKPGVFDLITANMVFEHLENPAPALARVDAALAPEGVLVFHTPNLLNYLVFTASFLPKGAKRRIAHLLDGRAEKDIFPTFYRINTPRRVATLASAAGLDVMDLKLVNSSAVTAMLGPFVVFELLMTRLLNLELFRDFRSNMIVLLQKAAPVRSCEAGEAATGQETFLVQAL
jgi:2-polyprenyl-3-methyl-5-hydroxy-6-metoxy-1,4-benzoquinol methylase